MHSLPTASIAVSVEVKCLFSGGGEGLITSALLPLCPIYPSPTLFTTAETAPHCTAAAIACVPNCAESAKSGPVVVDGPCDNNNGGGGGFPVIVVAVGVAGVKGRG